MLLYQNVIGMRSKLHGIFNIIHYSKKSTIAESFESSISLFTVMPFSSVVFYYFNHQLTSVYKSDSIQTNKEGVVAYVPERTYVPAFVRTSEETGYWIA